MDPTKTKAIRASFRAEAGLRLRRLQRATHDLIVRQDLLRTRNDPLLKLYPNLPHDMGERLRGFGDWFNRSAHVSIVESGDWLRRHLERAWDSGTRAGAQILGTSPANVSMPDHYLAMCKQELEGIVNALVQRVNRMVANGAVAKAKPLVIYRTVVKQFDVIGSNRLNGLCNFYTVRVHNAARLAQFRAAGVTHVGIVPERIPRAQHQHKQQAA